MAPTYRWLGGYFCKWGDHKNCWILTTFNFILLFLRLKNQPNLSGVLPSPTCSCKHSVWTLGDFNIIWYLSQVSFFWFYKCTTELYKEFCTRVFTFEDNIFLSIVLSVQSVCFGNARHWPFGRNKMRINFMHMDIFTKKWQFLTLAL